MCIDELKGAERSIRWLTIYALLVAMLAVPRAAADQTTASNLAYNWLKAQQTSTGLVASFQGSGTCYTYDQTVAAIAFLIKGDVNSAKSVLGALQKVQTLDGAWYTAYNCSTLGVAESKRYVGPILWVALAVARYERQTGDVTTYHSMATRGINWCLQWQQLDGGINGGIESNGVVLAWASTEHNEDAYGALGYFGYSSSAINVRNFLDNVVWDTPNNRFLRGRNDPVDALDVNNWGVAALGASGTHNYQLGLSYNMARFRTTQSVRRRGIALQVRSRAVAGTAVAEKPMEVGEVPSGAGGYPPTQRRPWMKNITVDGFDFDDNPLNDIWLEGTAQMAGALKLAGDSTNANYFLNQIILDQAPDGGIPYSMKGTNNGLWTMSSAAAVSSTGWLVIAISGYNPLQP